MADRMTGKKATMTIGGSSVYFTKITPKVTPKFGDSTDSGDYDAATELIYPTQLQSSVAVEFAVEGRYRKAITPSVIVAKLFAGAGGPYAVAFTIESGYSHFSGNYDVTDFQIDSPHDDIVTFTCTIKSNGKILPNS